MTKHYASPTLMCERTRYMVGTQHSCYAINRHWNSVSSVVATGSYFKVLVDMYMTLYHSNIALPATTHHCHNYYKLLTSQYTAYSMTTITRYQTMATKW